MFKALLDYDGDNFEDDHCLSFVVTYSDMFGQVVTHELVSHGTSKPVTIDNRQVRGSPFLYIFSHCGNFAFSNL